MKKPRRKNSHKEPVWFLDLKRFLLKLLLVSFLIGVVLAGFAILYLSHNLPSIDKANWERRPSVTVLAEDGAVVARLGQTAGQYLTIKEIPKDVIHAVIATEDKRFYHHWGIDPFGMMRAMFANLRAGGVVQGGSTITQQLAKNLFLTPQQTYKRKIQEAILALWIEYKYSKDEILAAYLNRVYLGGGNYGIDAASEYYFNKSARDVNLRESAILAGLLKAPSRFSPIASPSRAEDRAGTVLNAMVERDYITKKQRDAALSMPLPPRRKPGSGDAVRYFADYVQGQAEGYLGKIDQDLVIHTTLNARMQQIAEQNLESILAGGDAEKAKVGQGALISMTPDGAIRALVGGRNYNDTPFNRAVTAIRQPGSSFKPIIYLAGLESGLTADTWVEDYPLQIGSWSPGNYDGKYMGQVQLRDALAFSLNTVAIRTLQQAGVDRAVQLARRLGILSPLDANLSLALGTSSVTLLELTGAYATLANHGAAVTPYAILSIKDRKGKELYRYERPESAQLIDANKVAELTGMMTGVIQYGTGTGANIGRPQAGKTGTTNDYRDAWFMGFTPDLIAGVWVGNDDNSPMRKVTGGSFPARIWAGYMRNALANTPPTPLVLTNTAPPPVFDDSPGYLEEPTQREERQRKSFDNMIMDLLPGH